RGPGEAHEAGATAHLPPGSLPQGWIRFPALGSLVAKELADPAADLPGFVSIAPAGAQVQPGVLAGFLGPKHAPLVVGARGGVLAVEDLTPPSPIVPARAQERRGIVPREGGRVPPPPPRPRAGPPRPPPPPA